MRTTKLVVAGVSLGLAFIFVLPAEARAQTTTPAAPLTQDAADEAAFSRIDKNADKMLSLEEFKAELVARRRAAALAQLKRKFDAMDTDKSGALELAEFNALPLVKSAGAQAPKFTAIDADHSQKVEFGEYAAMVVELLPNAKGKGSP